MAFPLQCIVFLSLSFGLTLQASSSQDFNHGNLHRRLMRRGEVTQAQTITTSPKSCDDSRRFSYRDDICGKHPLDYSIADLMQAYHIHQNYWNHEGEANPWSAVNTHLQDGKDLPKADKLEFYKSGFKIIAGAAAEFAEHGFQIVPREPSIALDLGCGLGRLGNGLARQGFDKVICVDHAPHMLDSAKNHLGQLAGQGHVISDVLKRVDFLQSGPNLQCVVPKASVNFVHSYMTLQHMKPMLQVAYIEQLCDALKVGGLGYFQIPTSLFNQDREGHCALQIKGYRANIEGEHMAMYYTREAEIKRHLKIRGCRFLWKREAPVIGENVGTSFAFAFKKVKYGEL